MTVTTNLLRILSKAQRKWKVVICAGCGRDVMAKVAKGYKNQSLCPACSVRGKTQLSDQKGRTHRASEFVPNEDDYSEDSMP